MSGDRGAQAAGPPLPIQRSRNLYLRNAQTWSPQCGGAPSNWKSICHRLVLNRGYAKISSMFREFAWHMVFFSKKNGPISYLFIRTMFECLKRSQRWFTEIPMFTRSVIAYELVDRFKKANQIWKCVIWSSYILLNFWKNIEPIDNNRGLKTGAFIWTHCIYENHI